MISLALWAIIACTGCHRTLGGRALIQYMADPANGLVVQKQSKHLDIIVQYLPSAYEVWQDISLGATYSQEQADSAVKAYDTFYYFRMVIRNAPPAESLSDYFNFGIRRELLLIRHKDTIPCAICQRVANGNSSLKEYLIAFPRQKAAGSGEFSHDLKFLYTGGTLGLSPDVFQFSKTILSKVPGLKI